MNRFSYLVLLIIILYLSNKFFNPVPTISNLPRVHGNAGCIIKHNNLIIIVKDTKLNKWDIPSGKPRNNKELAHETARREAYEET